MTSGLIIFLKYPEKGKVKTRLAKKIGSDKALELYWYLVHNTICNSNGTHFAELHFQNQLPSKHPFLNLTCKYQKGENIGERMFNSLASVLDSAELAILIGADIPEMSTDVIEEAVKILQSNDVVFGPSKDGGYYLVGMKKACREIFELEEWSHSKVLEQTIEKVKQLGLSFDFTKELNDLDTFEDLKDFPKLLEMI